MTLKQLETELKNLKLWLDTFIPDKYNQISGLDADKPSVCFLPTIYTSTDTREVHFWAVDQWIASHEGAATYAPFVGGSSTATGARDGLVKYPLKNAEVDQTDSFHYLGGDNFFHDLDAQVTRLDYKKTDTTYKLFKGGDKTTGIDGLVSFPLKNTEVDQANKVHYLGGDNFFHDLDAQLTLLDYKKTDTTYELATANKAGLIKLRDNADRESSRYVLTGKGTFKNLHITNEDNGSTEWGFSCEYLNGKLVHLQDQINVKSYNLASTTKEGLIRKLPDGGSGTVAPHYNYTSSGWEEFELVSTKKDDTIEHKAYDTKYVNAIENTLQKEFVGATQKTYGARVNDGSKGLVPAPEGVDISTGHLLASSGKWVRAIDAIPTFTSSATAGDGESNAGLVPTPKDMPAGSLLGLNGWTSVEIPTAVFTGASSDQITSEPIDGVKGLVPAPKGTDIGSVLRGDSTWVKPESFPVADMDKPGNMPKLMSTYNSEGQRVPKDDHILLSNGQWGSMPVSSVVTTKKAGLVPAMTHEDPGALLSGTTWKKWDEIIPIFTGPRNGEGYNDDMLFEGDRGLVPGSTLEQWGYVLTTNGWSEPDKELHFHAKGNHEEGTVKRPPKDTRPADPDNEGRLLNEFNEWVDPNDLQATDAELMERGFNKTENNFTSVLKTKLDEIDMSTKADTTKVTTLEDDIVTVTATANVNKKESLQTNKDVTALTSVVTTLSNDVGKKAEASAVEALAVKVANIKDTDTTYSIKDGELSEKNFTDELQAKLSKIEDNANFYKLPADVVHDANYVSTEKSFTAEEKKKLAGLDSSLFLGEYLTLDALIASNPTPKAGSHAYVDEGIDKNVVKYIWDTTDNTWFLQSGKVTAETAATIKTKYETNADTNVFDDAAKQKLEKIEAGAQKNEPQPPLLGTKAISDSEAAKASIYSAQYINSALNDKADGADVTQLGTDVLIAQTTAEACTTLAGEISSKQDTNTTNIALKADKTTVTALETKVNNLKDENTTYEVATTESAGLLRKLNSDDASFMDGQGNWTSPYKLHSPDGTRKVLAHNTMVRIDQEGARIEMKSGYTAIMSPDKENEVLVNDTGVSIDGHVTIAGKKYVHTDMNYSVADHNKLFKIDMDTKADATAVTALDTKVDDLVKTDNNYSTADKDKLKGIDLTKYALDAHTHSDYATTGHSHDYSSVFAPKSHSHNYADKSHSHNYSPTTHTHDYTKVFAPKSHTHSYAAMSHTHNGVYAPNSHSHSNYASIGGSTGQAFNCKDSTVASNAVNNTRMIDYVTGLGYKTTDNNTHRGITSALNSSSTAISLSANAGRNLQNQINALPKTDTNTHPTKEQLEAMGFSTTDNNTHRGITSALNSSSTSISLSASAGRLLNNAIGTKAASNHTHNYSSTYAAKSHSHAEYATTTQLGTKSNTNHTHNSLYAAVSHNHNSAYAPKTHTHSYAASNHTHNSLYAASGHTHDYSGTYALKSHSHNYAASNHHHGSTYAPKTGSTSSFQCGNTTTDNYAVNNVRMLDYTKQFTQAEKDKLATLSSSGLTLDGTDTFVTNNGDKVHFPPAPPAPVKSVAFDTGSAMSDWSSLIHCVQFRLRGETTFKSFPGAEAHTSAFQSSSLGIGYNKRIFNDEGVYKSDWGGVTAWIPASSKARALFVFDTPQDIVGIRYHTNNSTEYALKNAIVHTSNAILPLKYGSTETDGIASSTRITLSIVPKQLLDFELTSLEGDYSSVLLKKESKEYLLADGTTTSGPASEARPKGTTKKIVLDDWSLIDNNFIVTDSRTKFADTDVAINRGTSNGIYLSTNYSAFRGPDGAQEIMMTSEDITMKGTLNLNGKTTITGLVDIVGDVKISGHYAGAPMFGEYKMFAIEIRNGTNGWYKCDGSTMTAEMWDLVLLGDDSSKPGYKWGLAFGTRIMPDARGRVLAAAGDPSSGASTAHKYKTYRVGDEYGQHYHALTTDEIPKHRHYYSDSYLYKVESAAAPSSNMTSVIGREGSGTINNYHNSSDSLKFSTATEDRYSSYQHSYSDVAVDMSQPTLAGGHMYIYLGT